MLGGCALHVEDPDPWNVCELHMALGGAGYDNAAGVERAKNCTEKMLPVEIWLQWMMNDESSVIKVMDQCWQLELTDLHHWRRVQWVALMLNSTGKLAGDG
jgi:hypothetical protein